MTERSDYSIRIMSRQEIGMAVDWAAEEGWNPGLHDADCFHAADPEGFLIGLLGNEPVATISVVRYGTAFGFLGFYIVRPKYRGMGFGLKIWNAGLEQLKGRTIGLDGVVAQQENYAKSGFILAYRNIRVKGSGGGKIPAHEGIKPLVELPFETLLTYDSLFFPEERRTFLECWINQRESSSLGIIENNRLSGYGVIRTCRSGSKIGPLFADRADLAEELFCALKASAPEGSPLFLDIPEVNPEAVKLAQRHNMTVVFETSRMYQGNIPELPLGNIYGVTTFELG
ncbi:MAG: GNAT family N-acetyltransferase [Chlorobium sp.]|jgi:GNAT superfamily N-acetyltransferase|nr:GNAT family N-acetyltransferase [Chlorobium sp.]